MHLTDEQIDCLRLFESGFVWHWHENSSSDRLVRFLLEQGLVDTRVDIAPGFHIISERGKIALSELSAKQNELQQRADYVAQQKAEKKRDRRFQFANTVLGAVLGSCLTLFADHFSEILSLLESIVRST